MTYWGVCVACRTAPDETTEHPDPIDPTHPNDHDDEHHEGVPA